jgi:hypothetical protein
MRGTAESRYSECVMAPHNTALQWTHGNVTHCAKGTMRAIAARH